MEKKIVKVLTAGPDMKGLIRPVTIEVEVTKGIGIHLVGLADECVKESLLRVVTAIQAIGFSIPGEKIVINISPASMYKRGSDFDLPIAIGILQASGQIKVNEERLARCIFSGELGLDGTIRQGSPNNGYAIAKTTETLVGVRPFALATCKETALEASIVPGIYVYQFDNLPQLLRVLQQDTEGGVVGTSHLIYLNKDYKRITEEWAEEVLQKSVRPL